MSSAQVKEDLLVGYDSALYQILLGCWLGQKNYTGTEPKFFCSADHLEEAWSKQYNKQ